MYIKNCMGPPASPELTCTSSGRSHVTNAGSSPAPAAWKTVWGMCSCVPQILIGKRNRGEMPTPLGRHFLPLSWSGKHTHTLYETKNYVRISNFLYQKELILWFYFCMNRSSLCVQVDIFLLFLKEGWFPCPGGVWQFPGSKPVCVTKVSQCVTNTAHATTLSMTA